MLRSPRCSGVVSGGGGVMTPLDPDWFALMRARLALKLMGPRFAMCIARLWVIRDAARECITPDGDVVLAKCRPLSDALYREIPGIWQFTIGVERIDSASPSAVAPGTAAPSSQTREA